MSKDTRRKPTAHLDERPILDATELGNLGLGEAEIALLLHGSTCISAREVHDRLILLEDERCKKHRQEREDMRKSEMRK